MQSLLEVICNKVYYDLKDPQKAAGYLEDCSDFKNNAKCVEWKEFEISFLGR